MAQIPTGIATGVGSLFSKEVVQAIAATTRFLLPAGKFYFTAVGADCRLQVIDSTGTWNNLTAAGTVPPGWYNSDGVSLGVVNNHATNSENVTYIRTGD